MTYSPSYQLACDRFRQTAEKVGWEVGSLNWPADLSDELSTADFAVSPPIASPELESQPWLLITSGLHGIEGYFGSAVQIALMEQIQQAGIAADARVMLVHGLNPYGFENLRRFDASNRDLNRNFLLPEESFSGRPPLYARLNQLLNPVGPPSRWQPLLLPALPLLVRHGFRDIQAAIAGGQYDFPAGLFFGGEAASPLQHPLLQHLRHWFSGDSTVYHLDFHTGLGRSGDANLLLDDEINAEQERILKEAFRPGTVRLPTSARSHYQARGSFGRWCKHHLSGCKYLYSCAEFGTYGPLKVLAALRRENQAHHYCDSESSTSRAAKAELLEMFCPSSKAWRTSAIANALDLISRASKALLKLNLETRES